MPAGVLVERRIAGDRRRPADRCLREYVSEIAVRHRALHQPWRRGQPRGRWTTSRRARSAGRRRSPATRPFHHHARRVLLPPFAPKAIERWEPECATCAPASPRPSSTRSRPCSTLRCSTPSTFPSTSSPACSDFRSPTTNCSASSSHQALEAVDVPTDERIAFSDELDAYLDERIAEHVAEPADDLISYLLGVELFGERLSHEHVRGCVVLLLLAGIDTTWSAIGSSLWHLATHAEDRRRLVAEPELIPTAVEELLRAYAPVTMARFVAKDHDFHGHPMKTGEWVLLPFPAANRDPDAFDRPDEVVIDRLENRHAAFGLGIHRCLGSNLARLELRVAIEEFLARIPEFELADPTGDGRVECRADARTARATAAHPLT